MARRNRTTDPHAAYSDQGIKLAFGRHWRDGIIHVATAKDGAACDCCCPACDRPLVARQGSRRRHFMHAKPKGGGDPNFECDGGQMTALHLFAQRLLVEKKTLTLPAVASGVGDQRIEWRNAGEWTFEHSAMEEAVGSVRPDVVLTTGENRLHVEIFVTHACPPEKVEAVRVGGFAMVEIDLSKTDRDVDLPGLENWILHGAPRRWIHNRHVVEIEAVIVARREERLRAEAKREERLLAKTAADLKAAYRRAERVVLADAPEADPQVRRADEGGWKPFITGFPALAPGLFTVHPDRWRSAILTSFLRNHQGQTVDGLAAALSREGIVNRRLSGRSLDEYNEGVRAGLPTRDAVVALEDYLRFLELSGAARDTGGYWTRDPSIRLLLDAQDEREAKREASLVERRRRIDRLVRLLDEIGFGLPSAAAFADLNEAWRDGPLWSSTPLKIAQAGGDRWGDLERALAAILKCMHDGTPDPAPQTLGLPFVAEAMELGIGRRHQRAADEQDRIRRREEEKVAELARQAEWRAADIRKEAVTSLGYEAEKWLSTYLLERRATPEELARRSDHSLGHARDALRDAVALRKDMNRPGTRRGW